VLFIMISNHYPTTYGNSLNWLVLALISLAGVGIRHYFNVRHLKQNNLWVLVISLVLLALSVVVTRPHTAVSAGAEPGIVEKSVPTTADILPVIQERCAGCHSKKPELAGFVAPPLGIILETAWQVETEAPRVLQSTVMTRTMPLGNLTQMTEAERDMIARWYKGRLNRDD
jgi:uncharacterized membrane protein